MHTQLEKDQPLPAASCVQAPSFLEMSSPNACQKSHHTIKLQHSEQDGCPDKISLLDIKLRAEARGSIVIRSAPLFPTVLEKGRPIEIILQYNPPQVTRTQASLSIFTDLTEEPEIVTALQATHPAPSIQRETFRQIPREKVDVLIVLDNHISSQPLYQAQQENLKRYLKYVLSGSQDLQFGVLSNDVSNKNRKAGCLVKHSSVRSPISRPSDPNFLKDISANTILQYPSQDAGAHTLEAIQQAVSPENIQEGGCNEDFFRKDASLSILIWSPRPDNSPKGVEEYWRSIQLLKSSKESWRIRVNTIVGQEPEGCMHPVLGKVPNAPRDVALSRLSSLGISYSICDSSWENALSYLSAITFGGKRQFFLDQRPNPSTIQVFVQGQKIPKNSDNDWTYDQHNNSIQFSSAATPGFENSIEVDFVPACPL
ncbi:MAG: hypothetical protein H6728_07705 [Myxococcales bacterium]|nr:hypothetical protein [Myxococcales bacterium]MCB9642947.1 hypothetical protein [Myxococcales bacterium]